jgi:hypothetical protein
MSVLSSINTGLKAALEDQTDLSLLSVFMRESISQDDPNGIYISQENVSPGAVDLIDTNKSYRMNVRVKFEHEGRTRDEDKADPVIMLKEKYAEAVRVAARTCLPEGTNEISGIYHVAFVTENLYPDNKENDAKLEQKKFETLSQFDFFTFGE